MYGDTKPLCYVSRCKIRLPRQGCCECGTKSYRIFWTCDPVSLLVTCILALIDLSAARWIEIAPSSRSVRNRTNSSCYRFVPIKPLSQPTQRLALIVNSDRPVTRDILYIHVRNWWYYWVQADSTWKNMSKIFNKVCSLDDLFLRKSSLKILNIKYT